MDIPLKVQINAWTGAEGGGSTIDVVALPWGIVRRGGAPPKKMMAPPALAPEYDWQHPDVGWGLVLPENENISESERATPMDAPKAIQRLLASRKDAPVLRYRRDQTNGFLRRYYPDSKHQDPSLAGGLRGVAKGALPRYLLIYASPSEVPWRFQYVANMSCFVGRLTITGDALDRYVDALISDWKEVSKPRAPVVWSVNHGDADITALMEKAIAKPLFDQYHGDKDLAGVRGLFGDDATVKELRDALTEQRPSLVVTTSHGMTGPLNDPLAMQKSLGSLVDVNHDLFDPTTLLKDWSPDGAIWYAHACCSIGSDAESQYADLLGPETDVTKILHGVAGVCGDSVAPLPEALLSADQPLRAFVGHVEPTFDWTLRNPETGQPLVHSLRGSLYQRIYQQAYRAPIGWALAGVFIEAGAFLAQWQVARKAAAQNKPKARERALYRQLVALDRQATVILGDPTVALPPLG